MVYKIDGTELTLQPTSGRWLPRKVVGTDGNGHFIYTSVYEFEIIWGIANHSEWDQILDFFDAVNITGSVVVELPKYRSSTYQFYAYTGCVIQEPQMSRYFNEHPTKVKLLVHKIRA